MNYSDIYNKIIDIARCRTLNCYIEKHHIIPKCMGGTNSKDNLVSLTAKEHFICHKLLCEIYPTENKLKYAYWMMCNCINELQERNYIISSREYERLKIDIQKILSIEMTGKRIGFKHSEESINKIKKHRSSQIFSKESNDKKSLSLMNNKNSLGSKHTKEMNTKKSENMTKLVGKKCKINGIEFQTIASASIYFNIPANTLCNKLKGKYEINIEKKVINGIEFDTISDAVKYFNMKRSTLVYRIKNNLEIIINDDKNI